MALLHSEAAEIYQWLSAGWPEVLRPGSSDVFVSSKIREILKDFSTYDKDTVLEAINHWRQNNDKFPTSKNIINEIMWQKIQTAAKLREENPEEADGYPMEIVFSDGREACYGTFNRERFMSHAKNPDHLSPEEWKRRFMKTRARLDVEAGRLSESKYSAYLRALKVLEVAR